MRRSRPFGLINFISFCLRPFGFGLQLISFVSSSCQKVKCLVCKRNFCCSKCRQKHEQNVHSGDEILHVQNQRKCDLCNGHPSLNFVLQNDFHFILHLCECHLPLHCKKCLTVMPTTCRTFQINSCAIIDCSMPTNKLCVLYGDTAVTKSTPFSRFFCFFFSFNLSSFHRI